MAYVPLWGCIMIVIGLNLDIIRRVRSSLLHRSSVQSNSMVSTTEPTIIPKKTKREFIRLIVICVMYAVVHVPASYVRVMGAMNKKIEPKLNTIMVLAFAICLPLPGIINFIIWILTDRQVIDDWIELLRLPKIQCMNSSSTNYLPSTKYKKSNQIHPPLQSRNNSSQMNSIKNSSQQPPPPQQYVLKNSNKGSLTFNNNLENRNHNSPIISGVNFSRLPSFSRDSSTSSILSIHQQSSNGNGNGRQLSRNNSVASNLNRSPSIKKSNSVVRVSVNALGDGIYPFPPKLVTTSSTTSITLPETPYVRENIVLNDEMKA